MRKLGYEFDYEYWLSGYSYVLGEVVVKLFRIAVLDQVADPAATANLKLLDSSAKWTVKAYVNVAQLTDLDGLSKASAQLEKLQNEIAPIVALKVPDRLAFDSRVMARPR